MSESARPLYERAGGGQSRVRGRGRRGHRHRSDKLRLPNLVADASPTVATQSRRCRDAVATVATVGDTVGDAVATVADSVAGLPTASRAFATTYGGDRRAGAIFYLSRPMTRS